MQSSHTPPAMPLSHSDLISVMHLHGLAAPESVCYGFLGATLPAFFLRETARVNLRLSIMKDLLDLHKSNSCNENDYKIKSQHFLNTLTPAQRQIADEINAFCQAILFHYQPELFCDWFPINEAPLQYDFLKTLPLTMPKALEEELEHIDGKPTVATSEWHLSAFDYSELADFLSLVKLASETVPSPILIELHSTTHSTLITYNTKENAWHHADAQFCGIADNTNTLAQASALKILFAGEANVIVSMRFLALTQKNLNQFIKCLQENPLYNVLFEIDEAKTLRRGFHEEHILHIAAQIGSLSRVMEIHCLAPTLINSPSKKSSPLQEAIFLGHNEVIFYLLEKADRSIPSNHPDALLLSAVESNQLHWVIYFIEHGASQAAQREALNVAFKLGHNEIFIRLLVFGVSVTDLLSQFPAAKINYFNNFYLLEKELAAFDDSLIHERAAAKKHLFELALVESPHFLTALNSVKQIDQLYSQALQNKECLQALQHLFAKAYRDVFLQHHTHLIPTLNSYLTPVTLTQQGLLSLRHANNNTSPERRVEPK